MNISVSGRKHLGSALGSTDYIQKFAETKIDEWRKELEALCTVARRDPHAAYAGFTHGLVSKWQYLMRTVSNISNLFAPLEEVIRLKLIPLLTGRDDISDVERNLLALPCRLGGMGLVNPVAISDEQYTSSCNITRPLVSLIL